MAVIAQDLPAGMKYIVQISLTGQELEIKEHEKK
jgi:hypothetical protein